MLTPVGHTLNLATEPMLLTDYNLKKKASNEFMLNQKYKSGGKI